MSTHQTTTPDWSAGDVGTMPPRKMTEEEFVAWADRDVRAEWVEGRVVMMSPANREHAKLNMWLARVLGEFIDANDLGELMGPEYTVRLAAERSRRVPDLLFVVKARLELMTTNHVEGAPDLIVEIVSPDSVSRDWREKYLEYEQAGVREYWVIDPMQRLAEFYVLGEDGKYGMIEPMDGKITSSVLLGFWIKVEWLWPDTRPKVRDALRQIGVL
ncbi:MAG: Uma2 family endonuclease [Pirellulales bacterium]|nr:Uma2 family endonuclease [Pirellulales bacterium]